MPRKIKGYIFNDREKDAFESYKQEKLLTGIYGKEQIKVLYLVNQFGQPYDDFYLKEGAKPVRELTAMFGSAMNFKDIAKKKV